ncbi:MAG: endonuclease/exonuclease/phosphatase family protein [Phycisphaeraceae bacterium]|nr:endonuclease/exonuclease/phosphatase family protein [Phycisphaeraceae bacterium]
MRGTRNTPAWAWSFTLCVLCIILAGCSSATRQPRPMPPGVNSLTVMSFNVNYGLSGDPTALQLIRDANADTVFLQETTQQWQAAIERELNDLYPHMSFLDSRGAGGMAVLSRTPFAVRRVIPSPSDWFPAMHIVLLTSLGPVHVLQIHLHPPVSETGSFVSGYLTTSQKRLEEMQAYLQALDPTLPSLVLGDFNESDGGQAAKLLAERGLINALKQYDRYQNTWRWQTSVGTLKQTLDHIFYDPVGLDSLDVHVIEAGNSDHYPLVATFILPQPAAVD